jgi:hypothetical protein
LARIAFTLQKNIAVADTAETSIEQAQQHHGRIPSGAHRVAKRRTHPPHRRWSNRALTLQLLQLNLTKVEQCGQGAALAQIFDSIYRALPSLSRNKLMPRTVDVPLNRVKVAFELYAVRWQVLIGG